MAKEGKKIRQAARKVMESRKFTRVDALREFCSCGFGMRVRVCWKIMWRGTGSMLRIKDQLNLTPKS